MCYSDLCIFDTNLCVSLNLCRCSTIFRRCYADLYKYVSQFTLSFMYIDVPWFSLQINPVNFGLNLAEVCPSTENMLRTANRDPDCLVFGTRWAPLRRKPSLRLETPCVLMCQGMKVASVGKLVGSSLGSEEWQEFLANIFLTDKWQRIPNKCLSPV